MRNIEKNPVRFVMALERFLQARSPEERRGLFVDLLNEHTMTVPRLRMIYSRLAGQNNTHFADYRDLVFTIWDHFVMDLFCGKPLTWKMCREAHSQAPVGGQSESLFLQAWRAAMPKGKITEVVIS